MIQRPLIAAAFGVLMTASGTAAEVMPSKGSLGPLLRVDPTVFKPQGLIAVHGEPLLGLPAGAGQQMQRIGDADQWLVESGNYLSRIEWDWEHGEMRLREILTAEAEWCLSPDGKRLFAMRWTPDVRRLLCECFDLASGRSLWTAPEGMQPSDAIFSRDGTSLIVLHDQRGEAGEKTAMVSWWDAATGKPSRQVKLPGELRPIRGAVSNYLAESHRALYVAVPRDNEAPDGWCIPLKGGEPVHLDWEAKTSDDLTNLRIGGEQLELLAMNTSEVVELYRESDSGPPVRLCQVDISRNSPYSSQRNLRFSPDHRQLLVADCDKTLLIAIPAEPTEKPRIERIKGGTSLGDFTRDGKYFITVDNGGGVIRDPKTLERVDSAKLREFPAHCCPITEAGFSIGGRWIISNDKRSLLLWTREGEILAELASPNEEGKPRIEMQSPLIVDRLLKVYAADGWNFLEWDLKEVAERRKKFPGFQPRVVGKVVFSDLKGGDDNEPEHMTLGTDSSGKRLVTATDRTFIYRSLDEPEKTTRLKVAKHDVFMKPREIEVPEAGGDIVLKSAGELLALDPAGKQVPRLLSSDCAAASTPKTRSFEVDSVKDGLAIVAKPFGAAGPSEDRMIFPGWRWVNSRLMRVTADGRWLLVIQSTPRQQHLAVLAVVDWEQKKTVREIPLPWHATTMDLSADGNRLLVGSFNRSIYEFDLKQLCAAP
jgi:hypothetical protein